MTTKTRRNRKGIVRVRAIPDTAELLTRADANNQTVGKRLEVLRAKGGLTIDRFAAQCGVPPTTAREWLKGRGLPRAEALNGIAEGFGVTMDWVIRGAPAPMLRDQSRTDEELEHDVVEHIRRALSQRETDGKFDHMWSIYTDESESWEIDGAAILANAVDREAKLASEFREWTQLLYPLRDAPKRILKFCRAVAPFLPQTNAGGAALASLLDLASGLSKIPEHLPALPKPRVLNRAWRHGSLTPLGRPRTVLKHYEASLRPRD